MTKLFLRSFFLAKRKRNVAQSGATAVEFALISPVVFLLLMGVTELCIMEGAQQILESATYNTSRLAKTGYTTNGQTQAQTVQQILVNELTSYGNLLNPTYVTMTETDYNSFSAVTSGGGTSGLGAQQQIVSYTVTYPWKLFTPMMCQALGSMCQTGGIINLISTIVVRNEPYG